jgi:hypothetical protein
MVNDLCDGDGTSLRSSTYAAHLQLVVTILVE